MSETRGEAMRRRPVIVNRPVRIDARRYRPGVGRMMEDCELAGPCGAACEDTVLASRKIGSARVVGTGAVERLELRSVARSVVCRF